MTLYHNSTPATSGNVVNLRARKRTVAVLTTPSTVLTGVLAKIGVRRMIKFTPPTTDMESGMRP